MPSSGECTKHLNLTNVDGEIGRLMEVCMCLLEVFCAIFLSRIANAIQTVSIAWACVKMSIDLQCLVKVCEGDPFGFWIHLPANLT